MAWLPLWLKTTCPVFPVSPRDLSIGIRLKLPFSPFPSLQEVAMRKLVRTVIVNDEEDEEDDDEVGIHHRHHHVSFCGALY